MSKKNASHRAYYCSFQNYLCFSPLEVVASEIMTQCQHNMQQTSASVSQSRLYYAREATISASMMVTEKQNILDERTDVLPNV